MASADGTALLDASGNFILDASGNRILSDGTYDCECCWCYLVDCDGVESTTIGVRQADAWSSIFKYDGTCYEGLGDPKPIKPATVITHDDVTADYDSCPICLGEAYPCDVAPMCTRLRVDVYSLGVLFCSEYATRDEGVCTWTYDNAELDCGGSNFVLSKVIYDGGFGMWSIVFGGLAGSPGFSFVNESATDPTVILMGTYAPPGDTSGNFYAILSCAD